LGAELSKENAQDDNASSLQQHGRTLLGGVCAIGLGTVLTLALTLAWSCAPASARSEVRHKSAHKEKDTEHVSKEPFGDIPKGPLQIFISINQQKLHLYSDGAHVADSSVATGVFSLPTPLGVFSVIQKQVFHRSNIYSGAPMPYMQRITWSGVALHEGENIGHRASHGCIRMPRDFAVRLYSLTRVGVRVIISNVELKPVEFADPHLFVHKDKPPDQAATAPASSESVKTAQSVDGSKTVDAAPADAAPVVKPIELRLRVSNDGVAADVAKADPAAEIVPASPPATQKAEPVAADANSPAIAALDDTVPMPLAKPAELARDAPAKKSPIAIFVSRKEKKIYVRQDFEPLLDAAIAIEHPEQPLGTHVFTAMEFAGDDHTAFRWNVVSLPGEPPPAKAMRNSEKADRFDKHAKRSRRDDDSTKPAAELPRPLTPAEALGRIDIPQDVLDYISELMVPGSSIVVSDQGLGEETGDGTDFIVVTR
jgi:hypothetical protein